MNNLNQFSNNLIAVVSGEHRFSISPQKYSFQFLSAKENREFLMAYTPPVHEASSLAKDCLETVSQNPASVRRLLRNPEINSAVRKLLDVSEGLGADTLKLMMSPERRGLKKLGRQLGEAMKKGDAMSVIAIRDILADGAYIDDEIRSVLLAKNTQGTTALLLAFESGETGALAAFGNLIETFKAPLSRDDIRNLFTATLKGKPALHIALERGMTSDIATLGRMLETVKARLLPNDIREILLAKDKRGASGLHRVLADAAGSAVSDFGAVVAKFKMELGSEGIAAILRARDGDGCPCLHVAFANGNAHSMNAFQNLLNRFKSDLAEDDIEEILHSTYRSKQWLWWAISSNARAAVLAYGGLIQSSGLDSEATLGILWQGAMALGELHPTEADAALVCFLNLVALLQVDPGSRLDPDDAKTLQFEFLDSAKNLPLAASTRLLLNSIIITLSPSLFAPAEMSDSGFSSEETQR